MKREERRGGEKREGGVERWKRGGVEKEEKEDE